MSSIRIDKKHARLLDRLIATLLLRGKKTSKKDLIGKLIENAVIAEGVDIDDDLIKLEEDPAWIGLQETFDLGIKELSEKVDDYLYKGNGDE